MGEHDCVVTVPRQRTLPLCQCGGSLVSLSLSPQFFAWRLPWDQFLERMFLWQMPGSSS